MGQALELNRSPLLKKVSPHDHKSKEVMFEGKRYIALPGAAERIGINRATMHLWAKAGRSSNGTQLDILLDPRSRQRFLAEDVVEMLSSSHQQRRPVDQGEKVNVDGRVFLHTPSIDSPKIRGVVNIASPPRRSISSTLTEMREKGIDQSEPTDPKPPGK